MGWLWEDGLRRDMRKLSRHDGNVLCCHKSVHVHVCVHLSKYIKLYTYDLCTSLYKFDFKNILKNAEL